MSKDKKVVKATEVVLATEGKEKNMVGFKNHADVNSVYRISNGYYGTKLLNNVEYTDFYAALAEAQNLLKSGATDTVWIIVLPAGTEKLEKTDRPYWVTWIRARKVNADGTINTTPKPEALPTVSKKKILSENEMLKRRIAELEAKQNG